MTARRAAVSRRTLCVTGAIGVRANEGELLELALHATASVRGNSAAAVVRREPRHHDRHRRIVGRTTLAGGRFDLDLILRALPRRDREQQEGRPD